MKKAFGKVISVKVSMISAQLVLNIHRQWIALFCNFIYLRLIWGDMWVSHGKIQIIKLMSSYVILLNTVITQSHHRPAS